jgi:SAM-dependent methyltransferase
MSPSEHLALVLRALQIDEPTWRRFLARHEETSSAACRDPATRLAHLGRAFAPFCPHRASLPDPPPRLRCPLCEHGQVIASIARRDIERTLLYGRCSSCGHGCALGAEIPVTAYASARYYQSRDGGGAGYDAYESDREYREAKGERLLRWAFSHLGTSPRRLLEVGSAFGFARRSAERLGVETMGVDINPAARDAARRLYGQETFVGTLDHALRAQAVSPGTMDLVLYQFVLEHLADPAEELRQARRALGAQGHLLLCVPSMDAAEITVFGASYRSFRSDHLHLFSKRSLSALLERAGFALVAEMTECNLHLLREFFSVAELESLYARGEGPDRIVLARRTKP